MKIIPKYILRQFTPILVLSLCAFVGLYLIIDFFEKIDNMLEKQVASYKIIYYFLLKVPFTITQGVPMAVLLASLISLSLLKSNRELVAMETAGVHTAYYSFPIVVFALVLSVLSFATGETVAHSMNHRALVIWQQEVLQKKLPISWINENVWYRGQDAILQIRLYDGHTHVFEKATLFFLDPDFRLVQRLDAARIRWDDDHWVAEKGSLLSLNGSIATQEWFEEKPLTIKEGPADFEGLATVPEELNWLDLLAYTRKIRQEGYNSIPYEVDLNLRIAFPLTAFILSLLGITIAVRQRIHGGIAFGVGAGLVIASAYLVLLQVGCALATAGIVPVSIGVWAGNIIFMAATGYLWLSESA